MSYLLSMVSRARLLRAVLLLLTSLIAYTGGLSARSALAQVSIPVDGVAITQNFNTLAASGSSNALPAGWVLLETGSAGNDSYTAGSGTLNTGNTYSFGMGSTSERALGTLRSGTLAPTIGAAFVNDTGAPITSLDVAYWGEQWRLGATGRQDRLDFQYSLDATSLSSGTWTNVDALDFSTLNTTATGAYNGDDGANRALEQATLGGLAIPSGGVIWIRWADFDPSGSDDGLAVDDFSITAYATDNPPSVSTSHPSPGALGISSTDDFSVSFSEAVTLDGDWVSLVCEVSGTHAVSTSGGPQNYVIDVIDSLASSEECVLTVYADSVTDLDSPADELVVDYVVSFGTAGAVGCGAPATAIHVIQGNGSASPSSGATVTIEGVVVGDFQGPSGLRGFFVQEEAGDVDADPATSEGVFVYDNAGAVNVNLGDVVRVTGQVTEYYDLTELNTVTEVSVCGSGSVTPTPISLPVAGPTGLEAFEGMLVSFSQALSVSETYNLGRYGEVLLSAGGRLLQPTGVAEPGAPALAVQAQNNARSIQLDDGSSIENPPTPPYLAADGTLRIGDSTSGTTTGVLGYAFSIYELHPTVPVTFTRSNPRPAALPPNGTALRVAAYNVLNYFTTLDTGAAICGPSGGLDCRGANTASEFTRQRQKTLAAIAAANADAVGLVELENNVSASIADIVSGLNALLGNGTYTYINTGTIGMDAIKVGIIYKPAHLSPVGAFKILNSSVDPDFIDTLNRPVLAQTFRQTSSGEVFTLVVNHLKSKGSACAGDPDVGDLQGNCNLTRLAAAEAEAAWLATDPTGSGDPDFLLMGDFNSYTREDPIEALVAGGYTNLVASFIGASAYSYVFDGQSGYLDVAFASASLASKIGSVTEFHINADEPRILDYNQEFNPPYLYQTNAYRAADHDPIIVDFKLVSAVPFPRWGAGLVALLLTGAGALGVVALRRRRAAIA